MSQTIAARSLVCPRRLALPNEGTSVYEVTNRRVEIRPLVRVAKQVARPNVNGLDYNPRDVGNPPSGERPGEFVRYAVTAEDVQQRVRCYLCPSCKVFCHSALIARAAFPQLAALLTSSNAWLISATLFSSSRIPLSTS